MSGNHDCFLSHNSADKAQVRELDRLLQERGVHTWLDEREIPGGGLWRQILEQGIRDSACAAVLLGPAGLGPWHTGEMDALLDLARREGKRVIPVLLPGFTGEVPLFLNAHSRIDLRQGLDGPELEHLVAAILDLPAPTPRVPSAEFRLRIRLDGETRKARWTGPDGQESGEFPLALPMDKADLEELRWYLETYLEFPGAGDRVRARALEAKLTEWGEALFAALFPGGEDNRHYEALATRAENGEPCLLTLASDDPEVLVRPWEMARDRRGPLAFQGISLRRQLGEPGKVPAFAGGPELRVLLIVSRPTDTGFIDPRTSTRPVLDALDALQGRVRVDFCEPPTLAELERRIAAARRDREPFHIVHFDGHGTYLPKTGVGALCFEHPDETTDLVPGTRLGDLLVRQRIPLVLLETCRGAQLSDRPVFGSVAPALLKSGVGSVVAFSHAVHVEAARILVQRLYQELAAGASVGEALQGARAALRANPRRWLTPGPDPDTLELQDWPIPQLYQVGDDPVLQPRATAGTATPPPPQAGGLHGFPPAPRYRFQGRARELLALERAFARHPAVLLHAMGGMGKTALAREAAHWWRRTGRFPTALFHSFEQQAGAERVVQLLGEALAGPDFTNRSAEDQWQEAVRLFRTHPVLLVLDNFESTLPAFQRDLDSDLPSPPGRGAGGEGILQAFDAQARTDLHRLFTDLTADPMPRGRLLVTCRPAETGLPGIKELGLAGLARPDALHLLRAVTEIKSIDLERPGYEREAIDRLLDRLADHPLSIELVAPHLKTLTPQAILDDFAAHLGRFADPAHDEGRNRSLLASFEFSRRRLSPEAQRALPWLAWFEGGVFEQVFLAFSELAEADWAHIRPELEATALLRVEDEGIQINNRPFLKLHPTLPDALRAEAAAGADPAALLETKEPRFIAVYLKVGNTIHQALRGKKPAAGMTLMAREEANLRRALGLCFRGGRHRDGAMLADTLRDYLERAGRNRERDALAAWVRERMPGDRLDGAACATIRQHAWSLFTQGRGQEALDQVQGLLRRLEAGESAEGDPAFQLSMTRHYLGRIYFSAGRPDLALEPLDQAIRGYEALGEGQRGNLSAALGDLANALSALGRYDQALTAADRGLAIDRELGRGREIAAGLDQTAEILRAAGRHREAGERYREALAAARRAGDRGLEGTFLQHMGSLERAQGHSAAAAEHYRQALGLFQQAGNRVGEMRTCDLLASAELLQGRLDAAEAWYRRSLELAEALGDRRQQGTTAQNLGILYQNRAEASGDPAQREGLLRRALDSVGQSLEIKRERQDQVGAATSYFQLGILHRLLGDLERAEENLLEGLAIWEPMGHPEVQKVYANLAKIAQARNDPEAAARWQAKYEKAYEEQERRARGPEGTEDDPSDQLTQFLTALAQAVYQARSSATPLDPQAAEALAQLEGAGPPLDALGAHLAALARGEDPPAPTGLPEPLVQLVEALTEALRAGG